MSCCGACGGEEIKKEKPEEAVEQKSEQTAEKAEAVGQFDPAKK